MLALRVFKPPHEPESSEQRISLFLGGSIEMGAAEDWQKKLVEHLASKPYAHLLDIYNPRRENWDPSWPNDYNHPEFKAQVDWELEKQKSANMIVYYFAGDTVSPITLLELGLFHNRHPVIGVDPHYKRLGNLLVTQDHFPMKVHVGWQDFIKNLDSRLEWIILEHANKGMFPTPQP